MSLPYHYVNVLTGIKSCKIVEDGKELAQIIKKAQRPLIIFGPVAIKGELEGRQIIEYGVDIVKATNCGVCATAHTKKRLLELGITPHSTYDIIEIINHLKDPDWKGVKKEGNHDLVMFLGIRTDLGNQGLSTLKHYAPHLKTLTLCPYLFPHASYSLSNLKHKKWKEILDEMIKELQN